ncbi:MAG: type III pantothenate kinase [Opitutae bacterium]|mgnify:FL=1|nr:type III pantothenate kinase [Opitutae bacterium]MBT4224598.1 type III pantothenate kinase [Opitutae bacterium]MBT5380510.1 type III pantothenate kinase [Opitutae bacterium]MBT5690446.1 type III pantothenate kinase [Opitutae bacterium]
MSTLCLDIGNTTTHIGLVKDSMVSESIRIPTRNLEENLSKSVQNIKEAKLLAYCSVVPAASKHAEEIAKSYGLKLFNLNADTCPLSIAYPNPREIGQDRLANAVAATNFSDPPVIIIDMGTATTFDIVTTECGYEGGVITAGLSLMREYLHERTALLPEVSYNELSYPANVIGKSTREAMEIGGVIGYEGMVKEIVAALSAQLFERGINDPTLILTGGKAPFMEEALGEDCHYIPNLTLQGLELAIR